MIFLPTKVIASWDTWLYWHDGTYYLYYLSGECSRWDGIGMAVSRDGVHFRDRGQFLYASDKMVNFLGTGSTWRSPHFKEDGFYYCNYSEWRQMSDGHIENQIFMARSLDLIHWKKMGQDTDFVCDNRWYTADIAEGGRWDCIFTLPKAGGGLYGYLTAKAKDRRSFGMAESADGCHWNALPPPELDFSPFEIQDPREVEVGAVCEHGGKYYCLLGIDTIGMFVAKADSPYGPFRAQEKNFMLLNNQSGVDAYFMRFFETPEGLFVNHHSVAHEKSHEGHIKAYLAPLKKVYFDEEGTLWICWWPQNEVLKGRELAEAVTSAGEVACERFIVEARAQGASRLELALRDSSMLQISLCGDGTIHYIHTGMCGTRELQHLGKKVDLHTNYTIRLLVRESLTELYINDRFITACTAPDACRAFLGGQELYSLRLWELK